MIRSRPLRPTVWRMRGSLRLAVFGAVALAATGCSASSRSPVDKAVVTHVRGLPDGVAVPAAPTIQTVSAARASADEIYVVTWDSISCPRLPISVRADGPQRVAINTAKHQLFSGSTACTSDLAATTSTVKLPPTINFKTEVIVSIDGTAIRLPAPRS